MLYTTVKQYMKTTRESSPWTKEEYEILKAQYPFLGPKNLATTLNKPWRKIYDKARRLGIKVLKEHCHDRNCNISDVSQFVSKYSPESVYLMGLLWADGHLSKHNNKQRSYTTSITLISRDFDQVKNIFQKTGDWKFYIRRAKGKNKQAGRAILNNKELHQFLSSCDMKNKTLGNEKNILDKIPENLHSYFWRGFFDGDGYISDTPRRRAVIITGSYKQDWSALNLILDNLQINYKTKRILSDNGSCSRIIISRIKDIEKFGLYIYQGIIFGLERKRIKFESQKLYA